jgi:cyclomaltodextrinase
MLAVAATGCTGAEEGDDVSPTPSETATFRLVSTGGDVFAWEERLRGEGECSDVVALVDGAEVDTTVEVEGEGFAFRVPILTGPQDVAARCTLADGSVVETEPVTFRGMLEARPTARIDVTVDGSTVVFDAAPSEPTRPGSTPIDAYEWTPHRQIGEPEPELRLAGGARFRREDGRRLTLEAPTRDGEYFVTLTMTDEDGRADSSTTYFVVEDGRPRTVDLMNEHPAWIDRAIMYAANHRIWGGGAANVERRLPYLKRLGVDALWLWPPTSRRAVGEEYQIVDHFALDEEWGTEEDFRRLVERAHELGLRVLLDFVPNHTSDQHPYYVTAQSEGPNSHYWDFYDREPNGDVTSYTGIFHSFLPNLNFDDRQVRTMVTEAFAYWIREFDVDGFRVDAAWAIERRRPDYWPEWREELKRIKPDLLLLAEATARDAYYFENGFDVGYEWTDHPGRWPWANLWQFPQEIQALAEPALTNQGRGYPRDAIVLRFLNNNDTGERFVDRYGPDLTRVASAMMFTVPGLPLLFGGDEIGASYEPYSETLDIPWKDRYGLREWYDSLIRLRGTQPALLSREMSVLTTDWGSVIAYVRPSFRGGDPVLVVLNFAGRANPSIQASPALDEVLSTGTVEDVLTGDRINVRPGRDLTLRMPSHSVFVLVPSSGGAS